MKAVLIVILAMLAICIPSAVQAAPPLQAANSKPMVKTVCAPAVGYQSVGELKAELLTQAKAEAVNELFGQYLSASTEVENFVVTSDEIRTSSVGYVRVDGNASYYNGDNLAEVCVTINAYATEEDFLNFEPLALDKRNCITDENLTASELAAHAKEEAIYQALLDYDRALGANDRKAVLPLLKQVDYLESDFVSGTESYCVQVTGYVVPVEVKAFLDVGSTEGLAVADIDHADGQSDATGAEPEQSPPTSEECSDTMVYGQSMICNIAAKGQEYFHSFEGQANDIVTITLVKQNGKYLPSFKVLDPDGEEMYQCNDYDDIARKTCTLPIDGQYKIVVSDYNRSYTGDYRLTVQRLNPPAGAVKLELGTIQGGKIAEVAERDYYMFDALANQKVTVTVTKQDGKFLPSFQVIDPDGEEIYRCNDYDDIAQKECTLPLDGSYLVVVWDYNSLDGGNYTIQIASH